MVGEEKKLVNNDQVEVKISYIIKVKNTKKLNKEI